MDGIDLTARDQWVTKRVAMQALRVGPQTLEQYIQRGLIRAYAPPIGRTLIAKADLDNVVRSSIRTATAGA